jgi:dienelactone hydrolase
MQTITYPGAHHGFDQPTGSVRFLPNAYNPTAVGERGAHVGRHPEARLAAIDEVMQFVKKALRQPARPPGK